MIDTNDRVIPLTDVVFTNDAASLDYYPVAVRAHHLPLGGCPVTSRLKRDPCAQPYDRSRRRAQAQHAYEHRVDLALA